MQGAALKYAAKLTLWTLCPLPKARTTAPVCRDGGRGRQYKQCPALRMDSWKNGHICSLNPWILWTSSFYLVQFHVHFGSAHYLPAIYMHRQKVPVLKNSGCTKYFYGFAQCSHCRQFLVFAMKNCFWTLLKWYSDNGLMCKILPS